MITDTEQKRHGFPLLPIIFITAIFFLNMLSRVVFGPLMPVLERDLHLSHGEAGSLFLILALGYSTGLLVSGFFSSRLNHRRTIVLSSSALGISLLIISTGGSLLWIVGGLIAAGIATGLYLPSGVSILTSQVNPRNWGKAYAIHELAPNLSFICAPLVVEIVLRWSSWRMVPVLLGLVAIILGVVFSRFGQGGDFPGETIHFGTFKTLAGIPSFWLMMLFLGLGVGASVGVYTMIPLYLYTEYNMDQSMVNELLAISRVPALGLSFLGGWVSDRLGPTAAMRGVLMVTGSMTVLLGTVSRDWIVLVVFLQPMFSVCFFPAAFSALSRIGPQNVRNVAVSLIVPVGFIIGGGMIPAGIGIAGEKASFSVGMILFGCVLLAALFLLRFLKLNDHHGEGA